MSTQKMEMSSLLPMGAGERNSIKREYLDERMLPHPCIRCTARFPTGSKLLQHMREDHPTIQHVRPGMPLNAPSPPRDNDRFINTTAICPMCQRDCQSRKKLMRHLEIDHKEDEEEPQLKVIRLTGDDQNKQKLLEQFQQQSENVAGPFITPVRSQSNMVQNLLKAIGTGNKTAPHVKVESKSASKLQYKCFWCDASYRKRGKLMDHIDNLHKHNKQAENKMSGSLEDSKPQGGQQPMSMMGHNTSLDRLNAVGVPQFIPGLPPFHALSKQSITGTNQLSQHPTTSIRPKSNGPCSFTLSGSLTPKPKPPAKENPKPDSCTFFMTKKENPLANIKSNPITAGLRTGDRRRSSLPNLFDTSSSPYGFPYGMLPQNPMAAAASMHQRLFMSQMRPPMMHPSQFYSQRVPMMMPGSTDYLLNQTQQMLEHQTSQAQMFARINAMAQTSPLRPKNPESPLDLTKSYL